MGDPLITQIQYSEADTPLHVHYHLACEMVFVCEGEANFTINGKSYLAQKNSILFINSYEQHQMTILQKPYRRFFVMVQGAELEPAFPSSVLPSVFKNRPAGFSHCVSLPESTDAKQLFLRLLAEANSSDAFHNQMVRSLIEQILILVYRSCPDNFPAENSANKRISSVQRYIETHFTEEIKIAELARKYYMNHCYLSHLFKEQVGYSPKQYLQLIRLSHAKELLETSHCTVSQISGQCGFQDVNHFIRVFREWFGVPPNKYRITK